MNSDLCKNNYYDFERKIQKVKAKIEDFHSKPRLILTPEEMEATEQEIGQLMDCLHGLLFGLQGAQRFGGFSDNQQTMKFLTIKLHLNPLSFLFRFIL